jgi:hypothetical protein
MLGLVSSSSAASAPTALPRLRRGRHRSGIVNRRPTDYLGWHAAPGGFWARLARRRTARRLDFVPLQRIA